MDARELIDIVASEHGRTSCSDTDQCNGHYSTEECRGCGAVPMEPHYHIARTPRCARCYLLGVLSGVIPVSPQLEIVVVRK